MAGLNNVPSIERFTVPAVVLAVLFLGYFSQYLFAVVPAAALAPGPLTKAESLLFNGCLLCLWWCYFRACAVDPGRYDFSGGFKDDYAEYAGNADDNNDGLSVPVPAPHVPDKYSRRPGYRWCSKCRRPKPPRAHHCSRCRRCIPKMDHHCPWTRNCVSLTTFPHYLRFLFFAVVSLGLLLRHLYVRLGALWAVRHMPSYLGPRPAALGALVLLTFGCVAVLFVLLLLFSVTVTNWVRGQTTIEGWEIDRHEALHDDGEGGRGGSGRVGGGGWWDRGEPVDRVEFPYDTGFFRNMAQAMGTSNILLWLLPFSAGPALSPDRTGIGWEYEENGFNDRLGMWPPPHPDKRSRAPDGRRRDWPGSRSRLDRLMADYETYASPEEQKAAFKARQEADMARRQRIQQADLTEELQELTPQPRPPQLLGMVSGDYSENSHNDDEEWEDLDESGRGIDDRMEDIREWTNSVGEKLRDFGVDEDAEANGYYDHHHRQQLNPYRTPALDSDANDDNDDDVPLGELLRRRTARRNMQADRNGNGNVDD